MTPRDRHKVFMPGARGVTRSPQPLLLVVSGAYNDSQSTRPTYNVTSSVLLSLSFY